MLKPKTNKKTVKTAKSTRPTIRTPRLKINLQIIYKTEYTPKMIQFKHWVTAALLERRKKSSEINIRIVAESESAELNKKYRNKDGATNVLSFPFEAPTDLALPFLGDIVICAPLVLEEALAQKKTIEAHWAHLTIHGVLHLLGYTHDTEKNAHAMENLETKLMESLGFDNPYV